MNIIDRCWRRHPNWSANRQRLAMCSVGFAGKMLQNRGREVVSYTVTDPSDDPVNPRPGTLRFGTTILKGKVWITFQKDMNIKLLQPLIVKSFTTIDGRGVDVQIAHGAGFLINKASNVIIHGLQFHHIRAQPAGSVRDPEGNLVDLGGDGDAIRLLAAQKVWMDHNSLYRCQDGLLDVTRGSTEITISNNWFRDHDKVMLLGHDDSFAEDKNMKVTVVYNRFGPNCNQRMPRVRHGYAHIANNVYEGWREYAIGGSMNPSVLSQGNLFIASGKRKATRRIPGEGVNSWNWKSVNDAFLNGAFFKAVGVVNGLAPYQKVQSFPVANVRDVTTLTRNAGAIRCSIRSRC
ncbi:pectate lyase 1-like [Elaeis guineensis]|uniref:Pectate lyase n=1 Tax=Elaeis guineensis var. tenera TaxID=51953 RepID=A0A6J0PPR0_ELAGV|nr:pectate lyase 1-like [Elaeis guineensis]